MSTFSGSSLAIRLAARLATIGAAVLAVTPVAKKVFAMRAVASDLRSPLLLLPIAPSSRRRLSFIRARMGSARFPVAQGVRVEESTASVDQRDGVRVVRYELPNRSRPSAALLWMHGGGTVIGAPEQANALCSRWAEELGILVVGVDYRLAPEHGFPTPLEDCYTALRWMHHHAATLGIDPERIAVGGDSAGGLLAASLSQLARDRSGPTICFQLLEYPMLDDRTVLRPDPGPEMSFVWSPAASRFGWQSYLGGPIRADDDRHAAPARTGDLSRLPPAWIGVGDLDLLHDECVDYAQRLRNAGVDCELHVVVGMYHGADSIRPNAPTAQRFRDRMTEALTSAIATRQ